MSLQNSNDDAGDGAGRGIDLGLTHSTVTQNRMFIKIKTSLAAKSTTYLAMI